MEELRCPLPIFLKKDRFLFPWRFARGGVVEGAVLWELQHRSWRPLHWLGLDEVRRQTWRQMAGREKAKFKRTRFLWLSNPENPRREERTRLSALPRLNSPIVRAYLLKEDLRRFRDYRSTAWAEAHLRQ